MCEFCSMNDIQSEYNNSIWTHFIVVKSVDLNKFLTKWSWNWAKALNSQHYHPNKPILIWSGKVTMEKEATNTWLLQGNHDGRQNLVIEENNWRSLKNDEIEKYYIIWINIIIIVQPPKLHHVVKIQICRKTK
jgi:hypothetical protein